LAASGRMILGRVILSTTEADERGRSFSWERKVMERCAIGGVGGVIRSSGTAGGSQGSETVYYKEVESVFSQR
jgi:hypothetical protein